MMFFFGIKNFEFSSQLQIPLFQNVGNLSSNISLYKCYAEENKWKILELTNNRLNDDFYIIENDEIDNETIFFLAEKEDFIDYDYLSLKNFNNFTDTIPAYRANLQINLLNGGFSSYQSDYPFDMTLKKGSILSSVCSIANADAQKNYIFIKNIYTKPIHESFNAYLVNIEKKIVEEKFEVKTNYTNFFELDKALIRPEIFLVTESYLGIPMYVSTNNGHISFEHTHPPHEFILSENKFKKVSDIKKKINEIIN